MDPHLGGHGYGTPDLERVRCSPNDRRPLLKSHHPRCLQRRTISQGMGTNSL